jgi:hypothetical protein
VEWVFSEVSHEPRWVIRPIGHPVLGLILTSPRDEEEGESLMVRRTLHLPALLGTLVAAVLMACAAAVVVLALSEKAEATFPGKTAG